MRTLIIQHDHDGYPGALLEQARAYVVGVRPTLGERVELRNRIDAAIRGEVPEAH